MGFLKWFPGGMFIVPMLVTALINTFFPRTLDIGGTTTPLFKSSAMMIIGFILFCNGATVSFAVLLSMFKRNGVYSITKLAIMFAFAVLVRIGLPPQGAFAIPGIALFAVMASASPAVYLEQINRYGTDVDAAAFSLVNITTTTAVPIFMYDIVNATSGNFDGVKIFALFLPFIVGFVFGNLDTNFGDFFRRGTNIMLPILGANFGAEMNLKDAVLASLPGLILTFSFLLINIGIFLFVDKVLLKRPGYLAVSWCAVGGASAAVPVIIIASDPSLEIYKSASLSMIAMATILTNILMPIINKLVVAKWGCSKSHLARVC
jgi:2-keto-3-deoxygluconate permease